MEIYQTGCETWNGRTKAIPERSRTMAAEGNSRSMSMTGKERSYIKQSRYASQHEGISSGTPGAALAENRPVLRRSGRSGLYTYRISVSIYNSVAFPLLLFIHLSPYPTYTPINIPVVRNRSRARARARRLSFPSSFLYRPLFVHRALIRQKARKKAEREKGRRDERVCDEMKRRRAGRRWRDGGRETGVRTEGAFIRVRHVFPRWLLRVVSSPLGAARRQRPNWTRNLSPQTSREVGS
jgi:hypothetical protein